MARRVSLVFLTALAMLVSVAVWRALAISSRQLPAGGRVVELLDTSLAAGHLAGAVRIPTVSFDKATEIDYSQFLRLHEYLRETYPKVHATLAHEVVNQYSLLYRWDGDLPNAPPVLLLGHLDVVPGADAGTDSGWSVPPFEGRIEQGIVWGRGAIDDKVNVIGILEAVELLLARGFRPKRTIYIAFGHDEELSGTGAQTIAALLQSRGVRPDFVLDEGGLIATGLLPGIDAPVAAVAIGEKGYMDMELVVDGVGGHSSTPPAHTAVGILSQAITRVEANPLPARLSGAARQTLEYAAPEMTPEMRLIMANLWLTGPLITRIMERQPSSAAQIRTTGAATIMEGSAKSNVLPQRAHAIVNFRLLPGDSAGGVVEHVRNAIADARVKLRVLEAYEAPPLSDPSSPQGRQLQSSIRRVFPDALFVPVLSTGATDARHYAPLTRNLFRFSPIRATNDTLRQMHGTNEHIPAAEFRQAVQFYAQVVYDACN